MEEIRILGVHVNRELTEIQKVQDLFSKYGCIIRTRLGLHEFPEEDYANTAGLLVLELAGDQDEMNRLENGLADIKGMTVKRMTFKL